MRGCLSPSQAHTSSSTDDAEDKDTDQDRLGIAQSALMCLDILAKYLGSSPNWVVTLADTLAEVVTFSSQVVVSTQAADNLRTSTPTPISISTTTPSKSKKSKKAALAVEMDVEVISPAAIATAKQSYPELLKLQGSVFLTAGTICGTVGPRGLPFLSVGRDTSHFTLGLISMFCHCPAFFAAKIVCYVNKPAPNISPILSPLNYIYGVSYPSP